MSLVPSLRVHSFVGPGVLLRLIPVDRSDTFLGTVTRRVNPPASEGLHISHFVRLGLVLWVSTTDDRLQVAVVIRIVRDEYHLFSSRLSLHFHLVISWLIVSVFLTSLEPRKKMTRTLCLVRDGRDGIGETNLLSTTCM